MNLFGGREGGREGGTEGWREGGREVCTRLPGMPPVPPDYVACKNVRSY